MENNLIQLQLLLDTYDNVIASKPNATEILVDVGLAVQQQQHFQDAVSIYDKALSIDPGFIPALVNRGVGYEKLQRYQEAVDSYNIAIQVQPTMAIPYNNKGFVLHQLKDYAGAVDNFQQAITLEPDYVEAYWNWGNVLMEQKLYLQAIERFEKALAIRPDYVEAFVNCGVCYEELNMFAQALDYYDKAAHYKPELAVAHNNKGYILHVFLRIQEAQACFDQAIALEPDYARAHWNMALMKLQTGNFEEGWALCEWRWKDQLAPFVRDFSQPLWLGDQSIAGKTLLIHAEQGFGDAIQICRYLAPLQSMGAKIIMETPAALMSLFATLPWDVQLVKVGEPLPDFDLHCPIMSLPLAFKTTLETIPGGVPYLFANPEKQQQWQQRLGEKTRPRIGLVWSGAADHRNDRNRSIPLAQFADILSMPFDFHILQKDVRPSDLETLKQYPHIPMYSEYLTDFSETAALIQEMDLIISVDTSVAHLAGALGKNVWVVVAYCPDFRWLLDRSDNPWYPGVTVFRQHQIADWSKAIAQMAEKLPQLLS